LSLLDTLIVLVTYLLTYLLMSSFWRHWDFDTGW